MTSTGVAEPVQLTKQSPSATAVMSTVLRRKDERMETFDTIAKVGAVGTQAVFCGVAFGLSYAAARRFTATRFRQLACANAMLATAALLGTIVAVLTTDTQWLRHPPLVSGYIAFAYSINLFACSRRPPETRREFAFAHWLPFSFSVWILIDTSTRYELPAWLAVLYGMLFSAWAILLLQRWRRVQNTIPSAESQNQALHSEPRGQAV